MAGLGQESDGTAWAAVHPVLEIAEQKRSKRNPKQLDFDAAMEEFRTMFPSLKPEFIESVLRANNGAVDDTIDQLLTVTTSKNEGSDLKIIVTQPPSLPPKPPSSLRSSNEHLSANEEIDQTPALPPREGSLKRKTKKQSMDTDFNSHSFTSSTHYDKEWNGHTIPLLGKLPSDFLRINLTDSPPPRPPKTLSTKQRSHTVKSHLPMHLAEHNITKKSATLQHHTAPSLLGAHRNKHGQIVTAAGERISSNVLRRQIEANQRRLHDVLDNPCETDSDIDRFLEDERLALIMQNEEFLRELKRNEDFMRTLEFERDLLATRLAHEQKKNRQLAQLSPSNDRAPPNWMVPRPSERDDSMLSRSLSPHRDHKDHHSSKTNTLPSPDRGSVFSDAVSLSAVPTDITEKSEVHDFRDQLKSMGATSKKKFAVLAKKFFSAPLKKRKNPAGKILRDAHGPSTLNLLDDNDDDDLIDAHSGMGLEKENAMFEPLPSAWTTLQEKSKKDDDSSDENMVTA